MLLASASCRARGGGGGGGKGLRSCLLSEHLANAHPQIGLQSHEHLRRLPRRVRALRSASSAPAAPAAAAAAAAEHRPLHSQPGVAHLGAERLTPQQYVGRTKVEVADGMAGEVAHPARGVA